MVTCHAWASDTECDADYTDVSKMLDGGAEFWLSNRSGCYMTLGSSWAPVKRINNSLALDVTAYGSTQEAREAKAAKEWSVAAAGAPTGPAAGGPAGAGYPMGATPSGPATAIAPPETGGAASSSGGLTGSDADRDLRAQRAAELRAELGLARARHAADVRA